MRFVSKSAAGLSLIEVLIALSLLTMAALVLAAMIVRATRAVIRARREVIETTMAAERLEQLRALTWGWGSASAPAPATDTSTDLSGARPTSGGAGLATSPPDSLRRDLPGYVDFADARGGWVSAGPVPPPSAVFVRRWRISLVPGSSSALALQVRVGAVDGTDDGSVTLASVKGRKAE